MIRLHTEYKQQSYVYIPEGLIGVLDNVVEHKLSDSHQVAAANYCEWQQRFALGAAVSQALKEADS